MKHTRVCLFRGRGQEVYGQQGILGKGKRAFAGRLAPSFGEQLCQNNGIESDFAEKWVLYFIQYGRSLVEQ